VKATPSTVSLHVFTPTGTPPEPESAFPSAVAKMRPSFVIVTSALRHGTKSVSVWTQTARALLLFPAVVSRSNPRFMSDALTCPVPMSADRIVPLRMLWVATEFFGAI